MLACVRCLTRWIVYFVVNIFQFIRKVALFFRGEFRRESEWSFSTAIVRGPNLLSGAAEPALTCFLEYLGGVVVNRVLLGTTMSKFQMR